jgi:dihydrofolate synthase/folylpolyglutamate synthase
VDYERMPRVRYDENTFKLSRMSQLLAGLKNPQDKLRFVHIAGTKGKGSTATMLARMLENCGYQVGLYTSPHILDVRERISVNGAVIKQRDLTKLVKKVAPVAKRIGLDEITFFEILTAVALLYFLEQKVEVAILETGLGGRLDSTNVVSPEVCAITSISKDHTRQLGQSLASIAKEKAGIFKKGVPVVSAPQIPEVRAVLRKAAEETGADLKFTNELDFSYRFESSRTDGPHSRVCLTTSRTRFEHLKVPLAGEHQAINCGVALGIADALKMRGFEINDQQAAAGLGQTQLPGRMEFISAEPRILVDGAHNGESLNALMRAIGQTVSYDSMVVIFGCGADKDIEGMLDCLAMGADKAIFTASKTGRCAEPAELAALFDEKSGKMSQVASNISEAIGIAARAVTREDLVCVTGSFYLIAEAKRCLSNPLTLRR